MEENPIRTVVTQFVEAAALAGVPDSFDVDAITNFAERVVLGGELTPKRQEALATEMQEKLSAMEQRVLIGVLLITVVVPAVDELIRYLLIRLGPPPAIEFPPAESPAN